MWTQLYLVSPAVPDAVPHDVPPPLSATSSSPTSQPFFPCPPPLPAPLPAPPPLQCYIFLAYIAAMAPPGYICNLMAAGRVLHNMLKVGQGRWGRGGRVPGREATWRGRRGRHMLRCEPRE